MRVAFLCKRRYMGKDVILDRYARLYEIPFQLARLGHDVRGYCLSYQDADEGTWEHDAAPGSLVWESRTLGTLKLPALLGYASRLRRQLPAFRPDIVIGASDIPHVALGSRLARRLGVPFVADLYDNFESFGQARIPGFVRALRKAVRKADLVTTTSEPLREFVLQEYGARGSVVAMPSTIDTAMFHPRDKQECRRTLGLPPDAKLVGTAGGLLRERGIGTLYEAWPRIAERFPGAQLILAGPTDPDLPPPARPDVRHLGMLPHAQTAALFAALDVGVIYLRDTPFGRYCYPQKLQEMVACGLPIVAAAVGVMPNLLSTTPAMLYREDDADDCARAIVAQLTELAGCAVVVENWEATIARLERSLRELVAP